MFYQEKWQYHLYIKGNFIICPALCYRVNKIQRNLFDEQWHHVMDMAMVSNLFVAENSIIWLPNRAYCYRRHLNNMTVVNTNNLVRFSEQIELYVRLQDELTRKGWLKAAEIASRKQIIRLNLFYCLLRDLLYCRINAARKKWRLWWKLLKC